MQPPPSSGSSAELVDRHPDVVQLARDGHLELEPLTYRFSARAGWPSMLRRRALVDTAGCSQRPRPDEDRLFRVEGTNVRIQVIANDDGPHILCRAFTVGPSASSPAASLNRASRAESAPPATPTPSGRDSQPSGRTSTTSTATSSVCSAGSAFDATYLDLGLDELRQRARRYTVDVTTAWTRWGSLLDERRRRAVVDVLDDLIAMFGGHVSTVHTAMYYLDAFLANVSGTEEADDGSTGVTFRPTKRNLRYAVCVACMLAQKALDTTWPTLPELGAVVQQWDDGSADLAHLADIEVRVLRALDFQLTPPTLREMVSALLLQTESCVDSSCTSGGSSSSSASDETFDYAMWLSDACLRLIPPLHTSLFDLATAVVEEAVQRRDGVAPELFSQPGPSDAAWCFVMTAKAAAASESQAGPLSKRRPALLLL